VDREALLQEGEPYLMRAIEAGLSENLMLELKSVTEDEPIFRNGVLTPKGRQLLGKSLGAFANSAGGLLIIGVTCAKDVATSVSPIPMFQKAAASLVGQIGELLLPRHDGIEVQTISSTGDSGYIIVQVARSERRPHMSFDHRYYKRAGSSSFVMEHYDVEDAFRRVAAPDLHLNWRLSRGDADEKNCRIHLLFEMTNLGSSTAKHVSFSILKFTQTMANFDSGNGFLVGRAAGRTTVTALEQVLNPGQSMPFHLATLLATRNRAEPWMIAASTVRSASIDWEIELSAENMLPKPGRVTVTGEQISSWLPP